MNLFVYENYDLNISPEAYTLKPFKAIIDKDKTKGKYKAIQELSYIYFMCDTRSEFMYLDDETERSKAVIEAIGMDSKWSPDEKVLSAMEFYSSFKTEAELVLEDTRFAIGKLRKMLRNIDLEAKDDSGRLIYTLSNITNTIKQIPSLIKELHETEKYLREQASAANNVRGGVENSVFEDGMGF